MIDDRKIWLQGTDGEFHLLYIKAIGDVIENKYDSTTKIILMSGNTILVEQSFKSVVLQLAKSTESLDRFFHKHFYNDISWHESNYEADYICTQKQTAEAIDAMLEDRDDNDNQNREV